MYIMWHPASFEKNYLLLYVNWFGREAVM